MEITMIQVAKSVKRIGTASVPVLAFVSCRGGFVYECQNQGDTSKCMILVKL